MAGDAAAGRFACDGCGKQYSWKPELAGKRVKCKCGSAMTVPAEAGAPAAAPPAPPRRQAVAAPSAPAKRPPEGAVAKAVKALTAPAAAAPPTPKLKPREVVRREPPPPQDPIETAPEGLAGDDAMFADLAALAGGTPLADEATTPPPLAPAGPKCPSCSSAVGAEAVICVNCGHNLKTGKKLKTQKGGGGKGAAAAAAKGGGGGRSPSPMLGFAPRRQAEEDEDAVSHVWKELYLPVGLIIVGLVLTYLEVVTVRKVDSVGLALAVTGVGAIINFVLVAAGVLTAVRLLELGLGPVHTALLKIAAVSLVPGAVASLAEYGVFGGRGAGLSMGSYIGFFVSYVLTFSLFMWLLEMDYFESSMCAAVIWVVRTWVGFALVGLIFGTSLGGAVAGSGVGQAMLGGGGGGVEMDLMDVEVNGYTPRKVDKMVAEAIKSPDEHPEARAWLAASPTAKFYKGDHAQSVKMVEDLYAMGARSVRADGLQSDGSANNMFVELPVLKKKDERAKILAFQAAIDRKGGRHPQQESGQQYLLVYLTPDHPGRGGVDDDDKPGAPGAPDDQ